MSPAHFWGAVLVIGPFGALGAVVFPPGNTALPNNAMANGIAGPTVRARLVPVFVVLVGVTADVVVFFGGMAKPHLRSAIRPRGRPVQRTHPPRPGLRISSRLVGSLLGFRGIRRSLLYGLLGSSSVRRGLGGCSLRRIDRIVNRAAVTTIPGAGFRDLRLA